jgi:hypothetical protein
MMSVSTAMRISHRRMRTGHLETAADEWRNRVVHARMKRRHWTLPRAFGILAAEATDMSGTAKAGLTVVVLTAIMALASSRTVASEKSPADAAFERLKSLVGTWDTVDTASRRPGVATYTLTGGGKVLIEMMGGMATAYHLDKGTLMMTHYCGAGNQPRMRAKTIASDGRQMAFEMFDITNHPDPSGYYSSALDIRFADDGTAQLAYRGMTAGSESSQTFQLVRRRPANAPR